MPLLSKLKLFWIRGLDAHYRGIENLIKSAVAELSFMLMFVLNNYLVPYLDTLKVKGELVK